MRTPRPGGHLELGNIVSKRITHPGRNGGDHDRLIEHWLVLVPVVRLHRNSELMGNRGERSDCLRSARDHVHSGRTSCANAASADREVAPAPMMPRADIADDSRTLQGPEDPRRGPVLSAQSTVFSQRAYWLLEVRTTTSVASAAAASANSFERHRHRNAHEFRGATVVPAPLVRSPPSVRRWRQHVQSSPNAAYAARCRVGLSECTIGEPRTAARPDTVTDPYSLAISLQQPCAAQKVSEKSLKP